MKKTEVESFEKLPFLNSKFSNFFQGRKGISADLKRIFELNSIKNEKFNELPHNLYFGEDITEVFSNDGLIDFVCQFDNSGVAKVILGSFSHRDLDASVNYNFTITDNPAESDYSIAFTRYEQNLDFVKSTSGVENYSQAGIKSTFFNTIVSSALTGESLEARSTYGYYDAEGALCTETLLLDYPTQVKSSQSSLVDFRQDMLDAGASVVHMVDGKRAEPDKVDDIIRTTEQVFGTQTTEFLPN